MGNEKELSTFSKRLSLSRNQLGLTLDQFAKKLYMNKSQVSKWENIEEGSTSGYPNLNNTFRIAEALGGISVDWLWGASDREIPSGGEIELLAKIIDGKYPNFICTTVVSYYEGEDREPIYGEPSEGVRILPKNKIIKNFIESYKKKCNALMEFKDAVRELGIDVVNEKRKIVTEYIELFSKEQSRFDNVE